MFQMVLDFVVQNWTVVGAWLMAVLAWLFPRGKKSSTTAEIIDEDLDKLISYHETLAAELRKKKGGK